MDRSVKIHFRLEHPKIEGEMTVEESDWKDVLEELERELSVKNREREME